MKISDRLNTLFNIFIELREKKIGRLNLKKWHSLRENYRWPRYCTDNISLVTIEKRAFITFRSRVHIHRLKKTLFYKGTTLIAALP